MRGGTIRCSGHATAVGLQSSAIPYCGDLLVLTSGAVHVSCSFHVAAESELVSHLYSDGCSTLSTCPRISRDVITQRQLTANAHVPYCISDQRALADFPNSLFTCDVAKNSMPCYNNTMTCSEPPTHSLEVPFCDACCGWAG